MPKTLTCLLFDEEHGRALTSIMSMIGQYLRYSWRVTDEVSHRSNVIFVNLDHPGAPALLAAAGEGRRVVGCALRPRMHAAGTVHRPFRPYEVLAVLKEAEDGILDSNSNEALTDASRLYKLVRWPDEFREWPKAWWRILAVIRKRALSVSQIASETGVAEQAVGECLEILQQHNLVMVEFDLARLEPVKPRSSRKLWARIGERIAAMLQVR